MLWGLSPFSRTLQIWFVTTPPDMPSLGGFLYLTVASVAVGMIVSAVRWAFVDRLHNLTGIPVPSLDFSLLAKNVEALNLLIEIHYRHYQFYANELVAIFCLYISYRVSFGGLGSLGIVDVAFVILEIVLFMASRDTLRKYFDRSQQLLK